MNVPSFVSGINCSIQSHPILHYNRVEFWLANVRVIIPHHGEFVVHDEVEVTYVVLTILMRGDDSALVFVNQESKD